jgi:hypothetical protein
MNDTVTSKNHISKKRIYFTNNMEYFFHKKNLLPNIKDFKIIFVDLCSFLSFSKQNKLHPPKKWEKIKIIFEKKSENIQP